MKATGKIWIFYDAVTEKQTRPMSTLQAQLTLLSLKVKDPSRFFLWTPGWTEWLSLKKFLDSDQTYFVFAPVPAPSSTVTRANPPKPVKPEDAFGEKTITQIFNQESTASGASDPDYTNVIVDGKGPHGATDYGYFFDDFSADKLDPDAKLPVVKMNLPGSGKKVDEGKPRDVAKESDRRINTRHQFKIEVILINKKGRTFRTFSQNISVGGTLLEDELPKDFVNAQFDLILVNKFERDPQKGRLHFQGRVVGDYMNPRRLMFLDTDEATQKRLDALLRGYAEQRKHQKERKANAKKSG